MAKIWESIQLRTQNRRVYTSHVFLIGTHVHTWVERGDVEHVSSLKARGSSTGNVFVQPARITTSTSTNHAGKSWRGVLSATRKSVARRSDNKRNKKYQLATEHCCVIGRLTCKPPQSDHCASSTGLYLNSLYWKTKVNTTLIAT